MKLRRKARGVILKVMLLCRMKKLIVWEISVLIWMIMEKILRGMTWRKGSF